MRKALSMRLQMNRQFKQTLDRMPRARSAACFKSETVGVLSSSVSLPLDLFKRLSKVDVFYYSIALPFKGDTL